MSGLQMSGKGIEGFGGAARYRRGECGRVIESWWVVDPPMPGRHAHRAMPIMLRWRRRIVN
jgi:hypothetical protein